MKRKCFAVVFFLFIVVSGLFAQNEEYDFHLNKGKEYESQGKWIYALSEYYDAMNAVVNDDSWTQFDAYLSWTSISDAIKQGNPGIGDFDPFDYVDNWILILQDYELFWTENCPYTFFFKKPVRTSLNRENRTANYTIEIERIPDSKFQVMSDVIKTGFKKAYNQDWGLEYLADWPDVSVYSNADTNNYLVNGVPLVSHCIVSTPLFHEYTRYHSESLVKSLRIPSEDIIEVTPRKNAAYTSIQEWTYLDEDSLQRKMCGYDYDGDSKISLFDIIFSIRDLDGNALYTSSFYNVGDNTSTYCDHFYEINGVPQDTMKLIDANQIIFSVDEVRLYYGNINSLILSNNRSYLNNLPSLQVTNYSVRTWVEGDPRFSRSQKTVIDIAKGSYGTYLSNEKRRQEAELMAQQEAERAQLKFIEEVKNAFLIFKNQIGRNVDLLVHYYPSKITNNANEIYYKQTYNTVLRMCAGNYSALDKKYGVEKVNLVLDYISCNQKSRNDSLTPYYVCPVENTYATEAELFLENFDQISINPGNGWHFPSEDEIASFPQLSSNNKLIIHSE